MNCQCRRVHITIVTLTFNEIVSYQAIAVPREGDLYKRGGILAIVEDVTWSSDDSGTQFATVRIGLKP